MAALTWGQTALNKPPGRRNMARFEESQFAPQKISTPFPMNRYRILATFWERCQFFCSKSAVFSQKQLNNVNFSILHNAFTAFAPHIRGPPHLNLIHSNSNDRRSRYGIPKK